MKIKAKIFSVFAITGLVLTISGVSILYYFSTENIETQIFNHLEAVVRAESSHVQYFLQEQKKVTEMISEGIVFRELLASEKGSADYLRDIERVRLRLQDIVKTRQEIDGVCILDKNGISIVSDENKCIDDDKSADDIFIKGKEAPFIKDIHFNREGKAILSTSAPIKKNNVFLGVITTRVGLDRLFEITSDRTGLGETGETYLINRDSYIISPSRFVEDTVLKQKVDTGNARNCLGIEEHSEEHSEEHIGEHEGEHVGHDPVGIFTNYRGNSVLGAHSYISEMNWCLLAEIDTEEGFAPINRMITVAIAVGLAILLIVLIVADWVSGTISKPIMKLQKGAKIIGKGDLSHRVGTDTQDEIGSLSRAFDKMTVSIKESRSDVEKKVEEQTKEIRDNSEKLEEQQRAILNILEDVQDEKEKASKERDKISTILYSIGDGVFVVDKDLEIIIFNQAAADISGFSPEEATGKKYDEVLNFVYEKNNEKNDEFIKKAIATGEVKEMANHTLLTRKDGENVSVADSAAPLKNKEGEVIGCVVVFRNVTEERKIDKAKSEFVSLASHQLRTPLTAISWFTELLLKEDIGKLNKKQKQYLKEVYVGNKRMVALVGALLNVSRIELGTLAIALKPTNFVDIAQIAVKELASQIKKKKLKVETKFGDLPDIDADANLIKIVFQNILSNAVKYTPEKGRIEVDLEKKENDILFKVKDNGYGIPKNQHSKIFTKLFRADNIAEKETDGTGLGLYIVKEVVEQAGGKIWFESEEDKGTTFYITIPLKGMKAKKGTKGLTAV